MIERIMSLVASLRFIPHICVYYTRKASVRSLLDYERDRWLEKNCLVQKGLCGFLRLLNMFPEYRSLFYFRTGENWLSFFSRGQTNLYFNTPSDSIGKGLVIWHGYSTIINAVSIGENCEIWHMVTIGKKHTVLSEQDKPTIGDNVKLCAGAICIGDIVVASNSIVAAGAVVNHNVSEYHIAFGVPAKTKLVEV